MCYAFLIRIPGMKSILQAMYGTTDKSTERNFWLRFPILLAFAAGFDKDAKMIEALAALGFGFIEVEQ